MKPHQIFIVSSLALAALAGSTLGLWMVLGWAGVVSLERFALLLAAHGQIQVYGFVALFTMGVAMMVLPGFLKTTLQPRWLALCCLVFMVVGTLLNLARPTLAGALCQSLSAASFLVVLRLTRAAAPPQRRESTPIIRGHALYLATGSLWLVAAPFLALRAPTESLETVLWGFAGLYIAGIGLRVHPGILCVRGIHGRLLAPSTLLWNLGLVLRWSGPSWLWYWVLSLGVGLFLLALRPFRGSYLPAGAERGCGFSCGSPTYGSSFPWV